jgi:hypothetical protein
MKVTQVIFIGFTLSLQCYLLSNKLFINSAMITNHTVLFKFKKMWWDFIYGELLCSRR